MACRRERQLPPPSLAHAESEKYVIDPCHAYTRLLPGPQGSGFNADAGPGGDGTDERLGGYWIYGDAELESYRLALLRRRAAHARLKIWYPGTFHQPVRRGRFRRKAGTARGRGSARHLMEFRSNGMVRAVAADGEEVERLLYEACRSSDVHSFLLSGDEEEKLQLWVETPAVGDEDGLNEPPCLWMTRRYCMEASSRTPDGLELEPCSSWEWSIDGGVSWRHSQLFPHIRGADFPHLIDEPEVNLAPREERLERGELFCDFGVELLGRVSIECRCRGRSASGEVLPRIFVGESKAEALNDDSEQQEQSTHLILIQGPSTERSSLGTPDEFVQKYESEHLLAFRWARVVVPSHVSISISCWASFHPVDYRGAFACSDETTTRIWMGSAYTLRLCMHDFILDGIKRDRLPWAGDLAVSLVANAYSFADGSIVARSLSVLGRAGIEKADINGIVDYSLWWVVCHDLYQLYFGRNLDFLAREWERIDETIELLMKRCKTNGFLIIDAEKDCVFIDWVDVEKETALQILWWWALGCASSLAGRLEKFDRLQKLRSFRSHLEENLVASCWNEMAGLWMAAPNAHQHFSRHANILAVVSGLHSGRPKRGVVEALTLNHLKEVGTPYMKVFECLSLSRLNAGQAGFETMKDYWGGMIDKGATSIWEAFDPCESDGTEMYGRSFGKSLCHAWGAGPCQYLPESIFGILPSTDGWSTSKCNPFLPPGLDHVFATIPTPHGYIEAELTRAVLKLTIPDGITMDVDGAVHKGPKRLSVATSHDEEEGSDVIGDFHVKKWSAQFRRWHHFPHHVIPAKPIINDFVDLQMTDVPTVFQLPESCDKWLMSFVAFDGKCYQSFVARSNDLVTWTEPQLAMGYGNEGDFDFGGRVLGAYLYESYDIKAPRVLKKVNGKFWCLFGAYSKQGSYEIDPGYEGVAFSNDGVIWERARENSILSIFDRNVKSWEKDSIYQPWLLENDGKFYNFYNAKNMTPEWCEQIGLATSDDMLHWNRYEANPILRTNPDSFDEQFCADAKVYRDGDHWLMLYFGVTNWTASIMVAYSRDLMHWTRDPEPLYRAGEHRFGLDSEHAHKVSLVWNPTNETFYLYYCAVGTEGRGIGLITSKDISSNIDLVPKSPRLRASLPHTCNSDKVQERRRPNIVLIMADDLGFSDVGCFGSEIETPNIDALGNGGIRFTQLYNCARCCPSRASLLTGLYPHQAGIGHMVFDSKIGSKAYQGYLRRDTATIAEVLKDVGGYRTLMTGKWHVGGEYPPDKADHWKKYAGDRHHPTPCQRGFDEYYGTLGGGGSYFDPPSLFRNEDIVVETPDDYYYTDAINDEACRMIRESVDGEDEPFFLYVAHTAPHWPLHAPREVIDKYRGKYKEGWDELRASRHKRLRKLGIVKDQWQCSPRDENSIPWEKAHHKDWEDARMSTYAAQIDVMDQGIGRILHTLKDCNIFEDTMIIFLSDNGGCAEFLQENGEGGSWTEVYGTTSSDGTQTVVGNNPDKLPGDRGTFMSYGLPWANASNSPFRLFKSWVHEGGIATPFLIHWPNGISGKPGRIHHCPWIMLDIAATIYHVAGVEYPEKYRGKKIASLEGESFLRVLHGNNNATRHKAMFWEHQGNCAVRRGKWKLVRRHGDEWELFDMEKDRTEICNLAKKEKERVQSMILLWIEWAKRVGVNNWPLHRIPENEKDWAHFPWLW